MNLFKKALVASAVAASFGATAATVSSDPLKMSAEGVEVGNTADNQDITLDIVVSAEHPAASTITLTFDSNFEIDDLAAAVGGVVTNVPATGTGTSGDITFNYGTGSFTFDNVVVTDGDASKGEVDTVSFDVNLGNPITANSAFRIILGGNKVDLAGESNVSYSAVDSADNAIETGTGVLATEASQLAFAVKTEWDGVVERVNQVTFKEDGDDVSPADADTLVLTAINDTSLAAAANGVALSVVLDGNFDNDGTALSDAEFTATSQATGGALATAPDLDTTDFDDVTLTLTTAEIGTTSTTDEITVVFDSATKEIPVTGSVDADATFTNTDDTDVKWTYSDDAGEWILDATVINVPYFPVGFEGTSTSVHFANETGVAADVIVTAIDGEGNEYGPLDMGSDLAAKTVTKVSQGAIMSLFGIESAAKLSVTFNIDADNGDVNAYVFSSSSAGRAEISTSQQRK